MAAVFHDGHEWQIKTSGKIPVFHPMSVEPLYFHVLPQLSERYTAFNSPNFHQEAAIMTLRAVEEVSTQVPTDDFEALENKVYRTIELYKSAREARSTAERDVKRLREQLEEREEEVEGLRREMVGVRKEREANRGRVETMLTQTERMADEPEASRVIRERKRQRQD